MENKKHVT